MHNFNGPSERSGLICNLTAVGHVHVKALFPSCCRWEVSGSWHPQRWPFSNAGVSNTAPPNVFEEGWRASPASYYIKRERSCMDVMITANTRRLLLSSLSCRGESWENVTAGLDKHGELRVCVIVLHTNRKPTIIETGPWAFIPVDLVNLRSLEIMFITEYTHKGPRPTETKWTWLGWN